MSHTRVGVIAHAVAIGLLVVGAASLVQTGLTATGAGGGDVSLAASIVLIGLIVLGVVGSIRWATGESPQGERALLLFDLGLGGMALLLITSRLDRTSGGGGPTGGGGVPEAAALAWAVGVGVAVAVGLTAIRQRRDEPA